MTADGANVLWVVLDTARKDRLTPYGHDRPTTPTLGDFADEALVYTEAVAQAPWTLPVHASMFTGLYPSEHTATQESPYLPAGTGTLAAALSGTGYATACYSSNAWITPYTRLTEGFDEADNFFGALPGGVPSVAAGVWERLADGRLRPLADRLVEAGNRIHERLAARGHGASRTPAIVDRTAAFVDAHADERWFAFLNLMDAHLPYRPPERHRAALAPDVDPGSVCQNSKAYNAGARAIPDEEFEAIRRLYDAEIAHADAELGRLFEHLRRTGQWDDTAVIVCADHGELHGEFGLYGHEFAVYDPLINVPLLCKHPELGTGRTDEQVELLDLYDTVLETAGAVEAAADAGSRPFDPERSLLSESRSIPDGEYAFVEYGRPAIEVSQLESKAAGAGIDIADASRFYSRMCAVRRPKRQYIRSERIDDEAYRLDGSGTETEALALDDPRIEELAAALDRFGKRHGEAGGGTVRRDPSKGWTGRRRSGSAISATWSKGVTEAPVPPPRRERARRGSGSSGRRGRVRRPDRRRSRLSSRSPSGVRR